MSYVVIQPHSNTNPAAEYLVVDHVDWNRYRSGAALSLPIAGRTKSSSEAMNIRDRMNSQT